MNRKLRNTILAFSVTGMALAVGLLAAHPVLPDGAGQAAPVLQARHQERRRQQQEFRARGGFQFGSIEMSISSFRNGFGSIPTTYPG